jgi:hypothetical protein
VNNELKTDWKQCRGLFEVLIRHFPRESEGNHGICEDNHFPDQVSDPALSEYKF